MVECVDMLALGQPLLDTMCCPSVWFVHSSQSDFLQFLLFFFCSTTVFTWHIRGDHCFGKTCFAQTCSLLFWETRTSWSQQQKLVLQHWIQLTYYPHSSCTNAHHQDSLFRPVAQQSFHWELSETCLLYSVLRFLCCSGHLLQGHSAFYNKPQAIDLLWTLEKKNIPTNACWKWTDFLFE